MSRAGRTGPSSEGLDAELLGALDRAGHALDAELRREEKQATLSLLLELLEDFSREGVIAEARMCTTCRFLDRRSRSIAYCKLLESPLQPPDLRVDCPEHQPRRAAA